MLVALFDGRCVICQQTRRTVSALDWRGRVQFLDLHAPTTTERYPHLDHAALMGEIHVIDHNDNLLAGFDGVRRMMRELPLLWPLWILLHLPLMPRVGVVVYRFIARRRYAINRLFGVELAPCDDVCKLP